AKNIGARVIVTSRSEEKLKQAKELGADVTINTNSDWVSELENETIDLVIDSVGRATFNRSLEVLKNGGRIVVFGATTEDSVDLNLREGVYGPCQLFGSTMGRREELKAMIKHIKEYQTHPVIDKIFTLEQAQDAFDYLEVNQQFGKIAMKIKD